ncbi:MAG: glycosyltransferase family 2 protein [Lachnospiraceae bacterium]|nr:glycosyltransferase family 2 protein [Lachnospiraceae bacterium]
MTEQLVSIIIPTRNVGEYIGATIDSLLQQTYSNIEIVVVDYNSTDNTRDVLQTYDEEGADERVLWVSADQAGVSAGRNMGLHLSDGEYIIFMDGDDVVEPDYVEYLVSNMTGVALASCGYDMIADGERIYASPESTTRVLASDDMLCRLFYQVHDQGYVWNKMFRRKIIERNNLRFDTDLFYGEDREFLVKYLMYADRARMAPAHKYHYQMRENSAMDDLRESRNDLSQMTPELLDRQSTEVLAYTRMRKLLPRHSDAQWLCTQVGMYTALQLYSAIEDHEEPDLFRYSKFRKAIRKTWSWQYYSDEEDNMLRKRMNHYGWSGRVEL